jgi:UDP-glucose 4-epimerase
LSSAAVYGNPSHLPIKESVTCKPLSPYGRHKLLAEQLCQDYHEYYGTLCCSLRLFSAFGPGLKKQLLWDVFQKALRGRQINLFGTGEETRDFIYITDIIQAIDLVIERGQFNASIYNIANGVEITVKEIVSSLLAALNYVRELEFSGEGRSGDPVKWKADISQIVQLGYRPTCPFEKGIENYVEWLREEKLL